MIFLGGINLIISLTIMKLMYIIYCKRKPFKIKHEIQKTTSHFENLSWVNLFITIVIVLFYLYCFRKTHLFLNNRWKCHIVLFCDFQIILFICVNTGILFKCTHTLNFIIIKDEIFIHWWKFNIKLQNQISF